MWVDFPFEGVSEPRAMYVDTWPQQVRNETIWAPTPPHRGKTAVFFVTKSHTLWVVLLVVSERTCS